MICLLLVTFTAFLILLLLLFLLLVDNCCVLWLTWPLTHVLTVVQSTVICTFCFTSTLSVESVDGIQRTNFNQTPVIIQLPTATVRSLDTHHTLLMSIDLWLLFLFHASWFALPCTWQKQRGNSKLINPVSSSGRLERTYPTIILPSSLSLESHTAITLIILVILVILIIVWHKHVLQQLNFVVINQLNMTWFRLHMRQHLTSQTVSPKRAWNITSFGRKERPQPQSSIVWPLFVDDMAPLRLH